MRKSKSNKNWTLITSFILMFSFFILIAVKLFAIQYSDIDEITFTHEERVRRIEAPRGNILSEDGRILSVTMPVYDVRLDLKTIDEDLFNSNVKELSEKLSELFRDGSVSYYENKLKSNRNKRYFLLKRKVTYLQLQEMRRFPIFKFGTNKGGFIPEMRSTREYPFGSLGKVTVGRVIVENDSIIPKNGIEKAFNHYLQGTSGREMIQPISGGYYISKRSEQNILPVSGKDVVTTINIEFQDAAESSLRERLMETKALWGTVILMEVETGEIKAIANLHRSKDSTAYTDSRNHAIVSEIVPGSTFKLASYISLLEDGLISLTDTVDTKNGVVSLVEDFKIRDTKRGGYGKISFGDAFVVSSNVAVSKVINEQYKSDPNKFYNNLKKYHLTDPLELQLPYKSSMIVRKPGDKLWSGTTLPSMSYGYEMHISPLQILNFYNAIANNGKMVSPKLVSAIKDETGVIKSFPTNVLSERICSEETIKSITPYLEQVVSNQRENRTTDIINGTAKNIFTTEYSIAGKTGTVKNEFWEWNKKTKYNRTYTASFVGFFPVEKPKYSCIVVVHEFVDTTDNNHYGGVVAAPVFRDISDKVFAFDSEVEHRVLNNENSENKERINSEVIKNEDEITNNMINEVQVDIKKGIVPNLMGLSLMDVLYVLENSEIVFEFEGQGRVVSQSVKKGTRIDKSKIIKISLSS